MVARPEVKLTIEDYRTLPETGPQYQLIDGELYRMTPAPRFRHQKVVAALIHELFAFVSAHGLGEVVGSPVDVYLSRHDVVQPDVLFVSNARKDRVTELGVEGAPDLAIEVLSPSTRELDLGAKKGLYARHGAIEMWVVDLEDETLAVYELARDADRPARTIARPEAVTSPLFPGLALPLARILGDG
jgi:Uma2 family endonuclease